MIPFDGEDLDKIVTTSPIVVFWKLATDNKLYQPCLDTEIDKAVDDVVTKANMMEILVSYALLRQILEDISVLDKDSEEYDKLRDVIIFSLAMKQVLEKAMEIKQKEIESM